MIVGLPEDKRLLQDADTDAGDMFPLRRHFRRPSTRALVAPPRRSRQARRLVPAPRCSAERFACHSRRSCPLR